MQLTLGAVAELVGGRLAGRADVPVNGVRSLASAGPEDITFVANAKFLPKLAESRAGSAIVPEGCEAPGRHVVVHRNPHAALARLIEAFHPCAPSEPGVSDLAFVHPSARLGADVAVAPFAVVEQGAVLGDRVRVGAGCHVGEGVRVGDRTLLHPRVVLYPRVVLGRDCVVHSGAVVGADGFGFTREGGRHRKIPQVGGVEVGDDVEIGANTCIDGGTLDPTRIGTGTKIDNLVQVAHNCAIGERVIVCGAVAMAGSSAVEDDATLAGQAGLADHVKVGRGAVVGAGAGVISDVEPGAVVAGMPQIPLAEWRRAHAELRNLHETHAELRELRRRVAELESRAAGHGGA